MIFWFFLFILRLPFNWRTTYGYPIALFIQCSQTFCAVFPIAPTLCVFVGSCWFFTAFAKDISIDFHNFKANARHLNKHPKKMFTTFCNILKNFSDIKQLSKSIFQKMKTQFILMICVKCHLK